MNAMNDTFDHLFGGWKKAKARRWRNPDGSEGGIVAADAILDSSSTVARGAEVWPGARIGYRARIGDDASIGDGASIGKFASIGKGARTGERVSIGYHASIGKGASIGERVSIGDYARIGDRVRIAPLASIGYSASIGDGSVIGEGASIGDWAIINNVDWWLSGGPCGSRNAFWTAVYSPMYGLRWWVGCKQGITSARLLELAQETHGDSAHGDDYRAVIAFVEGHPGLARARAKAEAAA